MPSNTQVTHDTPHHDVNQETPVIQPSACDLAMKRVHVRSILNELAAEVHQALSDAALPTDVFFTVPSSGYALMTFATLSDPPDIVWGQMNEIACEALGEKLEIANLMSTELPCAVVPTSVKATDVSCDRAGCA